MGNTTIDNILAARIAQVSDVTIDAFGSAIVGGKEVLTTDNPAVVDAVDKNSYQELGLDLGPIEILNVGGKKVHAWTKTSTAFAA